MPAKWNLSDRSCWSLVCEEVIDTDHNPEGYDAVYSELMRRGFGPDDVDDMRRFAWRTAGWLNYDMMVWDWVSLDEGDIFRALDWQLHDLLIDQHKYDQDVTILKRYMDRDPVRRPKTAEQVMDVNLPLAPQPRTKSPQ